MSNGRMVYRTKRAMLVLLACFGGTVFTSCGIADLRDNMVAGTLGYVKSSTSELWTAMIPKWNQLLNP